MAKKIVFLLIGQKGSGKSFIGNLLEKKFNIKFVRVEDWAKKIKQERAIDNESYLHEVFQSIENGIVNEIQNNNRICFESTGLTKQFDKMLSNLKQKFKVITIKVNADPNTCLHRVRSRDQLIHINISDDQVMNINKKVIERDLKTDFEIENNTISESQLLADLDKIINSHQ